MTRRACPPSGKQVTDGNGLRRLTRSYLHKRAGRNQRWPTQLLAMTNRRTILNEHLWSGYARGGRLLGTSTSPHRYYYRSIQRTLWVTRC